MLNGAQSAGSWSLLMPLAPAWIFRTAINGIAKIPLVCYNEFMVLCPSDIFKLARIAGFPAEVAVTMVAIALRESAGDPGVHNKNPMTGDDSFGLWQINLANAQVKAVMNNAGINPSNILDPLRNAQAAFLLWDHNNHNLNIAWYINKGGEYQSRYESHLPAAQQAALGL